MRWILALVGLFGLWIGLDVWIRRAPLDLKVWVTSPGEIRIQLDCRQSHHNQPLISLSGLASNRQPAKFRIPEGTRFARLPLVSEMGTIGIEAIEFRVIIAAEYWRITEDHRYAEIVDPPTSHAAPDDSQPISSESKTPQIYIYPERIREDFKESACNIKSIIIFILSLVTGLVAMTSSRAIHRTKTFIPKGGEDTEALERPNSGRATTDKPRNVLNEVAILVVMHAFLLFLSLGYDPGVVIQLFLSALVIWFSYRHITGRSITSRDKNEKNYRTKNKSRQALTILKREHLCDFLLVFFITILLIAHYFYSAFRGLTFLTG